jgi:hypothetical protein
MSQERIVLQEDLTQELTMSKSNIRVWLLLEIPVKEGRRSAPTVRLVRFYRCEAPPSIVKSLDACLYSVLLGLVNGLLKK